MKKIKTIALATVWLAACTDTGTDNAAADTKDTAATVNTTISTDTSHAYTPAEGDVIYKEKKVRVMRSGEWVEANEDVRLDSGVVVYRTGRVTRDGKEVKLEEDEVVNKTGNFFDKTGRAIEKGWDATKEGAKEMAKDVEKAAEKVGKKAKDVVDKDDKEKKEQ